jgi:zona occludens toxin (predicted ATPase)
MTKVVYNACYGGFGLSKEAIQRYWDIKGQQVWIEDIEWGFKVWLVPPKERLKPQTTQEIFAMSKDERVSYSKAYSAQSWYHCDVVRHDPALVQVVQELKDKANAEYANLAIKEVDGPYRIDEYDGYESVKTSDGYDWIIP